MVFQNRSRKSLSGLPACEGYDCVAIIPSEGTRLLFLVGGFLVSLEEGLLDVGGDELVAAVLWLPTEEEARLG